MGAGAVIRYELMGAVRAWRGAQELALGAGKQRAVLALLLLNANRPVPPAQIIDAVWGEEPPENGANVVQKYIAGLRRALDPERSPRTPGRLLSLTDAGYLLRVAPGCLDVDRFDEQVRRARAARAAGAPAEASAAITAALELGEGEPLAGLAGAVFAAARSRLVESRASALELAVELELDLGRHERAVPTLFRLVAEFPLREQLRYLLILALYRSGRQAEALAAFRDTRAYLADEFGVEPGERLQRLHRGILRMDPALGGPAPTDPPPPADTAPPADTVPPADTAPAGDTAPAPRRPSVPAPRAARHPGPFGPAPIPVAVEPPPAMRTMSGVLRTAAVLAALATFGSSAWSLIAYWALRRRSPLLGAAAVGHLALFCVAFVGIHESDPLNPDVSGNVGMIALLLAWVGGAVHVAVASGEPNQPRGRFVAMPDALEYARRIRRDQARRLVSLRPDLADGLGIGRPHLPRVFDDGGLVDVNAVPEHLLAVLPGIGPMDAWRIVAHRHQRGAFQSIDDLVRYGLVSAERLAPLRERLLVVDGEPVSGGHGPWDPMAAGTPIMDAPNGAGRGASTSAPTA